MEDINRLGASHLRDVGYEVQRVNNFEIQLGIDLSRQGIGEDKVRDIRLAVVSGFLPNESNEVISLNYGNSQITVAGAARVNNSGSLVVRDFIDEDTEFIIDAWRNKVYDKDQEKIGFAADYKEEAYVIQYAPDGTRNRVWKLKGVWPSAVDYGQISYDSPGVKSISITLQYDSAVLEREDYNRERSRA